MSVPLPFSKRSQCAERDKARQDWIDERRREARIVVADVVHHSDHMLRMACKVLVQHGETPEEREDARILLVIVDAKAPGRDQRHRPEPEGRS
ncbi:hypothetical protein [Oceaniglobus ichthyenteri]|uniref:hypothetical protein n=1 Tax=Oceaniglobus ichthyenteri TaxID=2136177 RepID=UPI000D3C31DB|nr:hypothetical protein [Oceaniglobus ichthyenteri]